MNRILVEVLGGLVILVVLASFHSQIARLNVQDDEVTELKKLVRTTVESASSKEELDSIRVAIIQELTAKIVDLEKQVAEATYRSVDTQKLRIEIGQAKRQAALVEAQLKLDISRTQDTVSAYHQEMRTSHDSDSAFLRQTQQDIAVLANALRRDSSALTRELLAPSIQLNGDDTVGSGTLIYSEKNLKTKAFDTYALTSYHVIRNILADTPRAKREGLAITVYLDKGKKKEVKGDMVAHEAHIDAALIKLRSKVQFTKVARVCDQQTSKSLRVWDGIYAVGCPLGNDPIPTQGEVSSLHNELNGANYWMINAPTYFGNSGGGVYLANSRELVGVFSKIYTHGRGNPVVIPHMGLLTPMPSIRKWLDKIGMSFVLKSKARPMTPEQKRLAQLLTPAPR
ncbi:MAG: trypsin-like peptidase domain-containing protein [Planctomycetota bacterium]|nr:trypsin-like peptidase domain-containing protein [Planctomycetota bacterium]